MVWDEANRILNMGFAPTLDRIMQSIRPDKQMVVFSSKWSETVQDSVSKHILRDGNDENVAQIATGINRKGSNHGLKVNDNIAQSFVFFQEDKKKDVHLFQFLQQHRDEKILVFFNRRERCKNWFEYCKDRGLYTAAICGGKSIGFPQNEDTKTILATGTGKGVKKDQNVDIVINYCMPEYCPRKGLKDYILRIGHTGKTAQKGLAISYFVPKWDSWCAQQLLTLLRASRQQVPAQLIGLPNHKMRRLIDNCEIQM